MTVPPEAITAAAQAMHRSDYGHEGESPGAFYRAKARIALEAAAPLITAAERDRCVQLAEQQAARADLQVHSDESVLASQLFRRFARLLRDAP